MSSKRCAILDQLRTMLVSSGATYVRELGQCCCYVDQFWPEFCQVWMNLANSGFWLRLTRMSVCRVGRPPAASVAKIRLSPGQPPLRQKDHRSRIKPAHILEMQVVFSRCRPEFGRDRTNLWIPGQIRPIAETLASSRADIGPTSADIGQTFVRCRAKFGRHRSKVADSEVISFNTG